MTRMSLSSEATASRSAPATVAPRDLRPAGVTVAGAEPGFEQGVGFEDRITPGLERPAQPRRERNRKSTLGTLDERGRHIAGQQVSQEELALAVANLPMERL